MLENPNAKSNSNFEISFGNLKEDFNYRIEVDAHCTALIEKLFKRYVGKNTFVLTTEQEHPSVKNYLPKDNTYIICVNETKNEDAIPQIIQKFKKSGCTEFFLIMVKSVTHRELLTLSAAEEKKNQSKPLWSWWILFARQCRLRPCGKSSIRPSAASRLSALQ